MPRPCSALTAYVFLPAEAMELCRLVLSPLAVGLVRDHNHWDASPAQELRSLLVSRSLPGRRVDDEEDEIGLCDRQACLLLHLCLDRVARAPF